MLTTPPLALRVLRRIGRVKGLAPVALRAEDGLDEVLFRADGTARSAGRTALVAASDVKEHYDVSNRFFGPHQIEHEIVSFLKWSAEKKPQTVCEIGTAMGGTTYLLGHALPNVTHLIGVDLFVRRKNRLRFFASPNQTFQFFDGSSYDPETVARVKQQLNGGKLDLLFIDGDHSFEGVSKDFAAYRHLVRDGGIIAFHDIVEDYQTRYGRPTGRYAGGVPRFWQLVKPIYESHEFVESREQDGLGIGAVVYDSSRQPPAVG